MESNELNDHILISRRKAADIFGNYYSRLFNINLKACMARLPEKITKKGSRGCSSEMLLKWIVEDEGLEVEQVSQGRVPFQRSANIKLPDGLNHQCFHKFCQSQNQPLRLEPENSHLQKCADTDWKKIFSPVGDNELK